MYKLFISLDIHDYHCDGCPFFSYNLFQLRCTVFDNGVKISFKVKGGGCV